MCPGAQSCADGRCVAPPVCGGDLDCPDGTLCVNGDCQPPCMIEPCGGALLCDPGTGRCLEAAPCDDESGCFAGRLCLDRACRAPCVDNASCPGAQTCVDGQCRAPAVCFADGDCGLDRRCVANICMDGCGPGMPCRGTQVCEAALCVEGPSCAADRDCVGDRRCHDAASVCVSACPDGVCIDGRFCDADALCGEPVDCDADFECLAGRVCRGGHCLFESCTDRTDCPLGYCDDYQCVPALPACSCADGLVCALGVCAQAGPCGGAVLCPDAQLCSADGRCVGCADDGDCGEGACVADACQYDCLGDGDCGANRLCISGLCRADFASCVDDGFSPNGGPLSAALLPEAVHRRLMQCGREDDWFRVSGAQGVRIIARFGAEVAPLELALFNVAGPFDLPASIGVPVLGENWIAGGPGEHLLRVHSAGPDGVEYSLQVEDRAACIDDAADRPWRNDLEANARDVELGETSGSLCPGDTDWFRYRGVGRARVTINGATATVSGMNAPVSAQGPFTVGVTGAPGSYTMTLTPEGGGLACAAAPVLAFGRAVDATVPPGANVLSPACRAMPGPERVFRLAAPQGGSLSVRLDTPAANAGLMLYSDCAAAPLSCSDGTGSLRQIVAAGDYYLAVDGNYQGTITATLEAPPAACGNLAVLEAGPAQVIVPGPAPAEITGGCINPEFGVSARRLVLPETSNVRITLNGGGSDTSLSIRGQCEASGSELACRTANGATVDTVLNAGTYTVLMQGQGGLNADVSIAPAGNVERVFEDLCGLGAPLNLNAGDVRSWVGSTAIALNHSTAVACGGRNGGNDVVARFGLAQPTNVDFELIADFSGLMYLLDGSCLGVPVCSEPGPTRLQALLPAGSYGLVVDGLEMGSGGAFTVNVLAN